MSLGGKGSVNYSIEAATGSQAAAKLEIGKAGSTDVLKLNGEKYESAVVNVNSGTVARCVILLRIWSVIGLLISHNQSSFLFQ
jgi:hypothetical protein